MPFEDQDDEEGLITEAHVFIAGIIFIIAFIAWLAS
jgi:hypothetical protein